jgi:phytoene dehydrogenase-like protein
MTHPDAIVVGSGPNGLAAAITIAQAGHSVRLYEAADAIGGGTHSAELTLPGFVHDICSCVHPMGVSSPFFKSLDLEKFGLRWIFPEVALAHPFDHEDAAALSNPFAHNVHQFGDDEQAVWQLLGPFIESWGELTNYVLGGARFPRRALFLAKFGWNTLQSATKIAQGLVTEKARGVLAGMAGHSLLPLEQAVSGGFGFILWITAYAAGWPFAAGGSQSIANALAALLKSLGGEIVTGSAIKNLHDLPAARAVLLDVTPRQLLQIAGKQISRGERLRLQKYRYGPGAFKMDWALDAPIPWKSDACRKAGTVHIGGTFEEIARSERAAWSNAPAEKPFIILAQPTLFDPSRAPAAKHIAWAYCHVPHGSTANMQDRIETQIERFAPGFGERILSRSVRFPADLEAHNANLIGGDIGAGSMELSQLFLRPTSRTYSTSIRNVFLCSASTPPGPGVHGMCGHLAARLALRRCF